MEIIRKRGKNKFFKSHQTVLYHDYDDGYYEYGIEHDYKILTTGNQSGTTAVVINGKTYNLSNNCVRDDAVLRNGKPIVWARYIPIANIGPNTDGKLFWDEWTLANKTTISFDAASKEIRDSAAGFGVDALCDNRRFTIVGSTDNDGTFNVNGAPTTSVIVVDETPTDEVAGATITLATVDDLIWNLKDQANAGDGLGGFTDWDIPNIRELNSLINMGLSNPCIDTTAFPSTPSEHTWTSTSRIDKDYQAYAVTFYSGTLASYDKNRIKYCCRLVRS